MAESNPIAARFWAKVRKTDTCWLWTASTRNKGYGAFAYTLNGKVIHDRAHRFSWRLVNGEIPDGLFVLHRCDVPACVSPAHLFLGTKADNNADMHHKGRAVRGGTYGKAGYERGTEHHNARLNESSVREIRAAHAKGESLGSLSRRFKLAVGHVHRIVHRKVWRHV